MILLTDNDIIRKLACCDLLDETITAYGGTPGQVFVLAAARHVLLKPRGRGGRSLVSEPAARERLAAFLDRAQVLPAAPVAELVALAGTPKIDPGEQAFFAATALFADFRLLTGDKQCLRAVVEAGEALAIVRTRLSGRVICFEQAVLKAIELLGFDEVRRRVVPARDEDKGLAQVIFRDGMETTPGHALEALGSFVGEVRRLAPGLLAP